MNAAKDGLLALSVGVGLGVLSTLMEEEVCDVVGANGRHDRDRTAVRHGHTGGEVTLGGRRVAVARPRASVRARPRGGYFERSIMLLRAIHLTGVDAEERNGRAPA